MGDDFEVYRKAAHFAIGISFISCLLLALTSFLIINHANLNRRDTIIQAAKFQNSIGNVWKQILELQSKAGVRARRYYSDSYDSAAPSANRICPNCQYFYCPLGPAGLAGEPGLDGIPGASGKSGPIGENGVDVQLEPPPEFPCIVCPAGPPGPRGYQGERGKDGPRGEKGPLGLQGPQGPDGDVGKYGPTGYSGPKGFPGPDGPVGDPGIGGIGIPGPKGKGGDRGPKGPMGRPGRPSIAVGQIGESGPQGGIGEKGDLGAIGPEGVWGLPGYPGYPAEYCESDCGVRHVIAPRDEPQQFEHYGYRLEHPQVYGYSREYEWLPYWNNYENYQPRRETDVRAPVGPTSGYGEAIEPEQKRPNQPEQHEQPEQPTNLRVEAGPPSAIPPSSHNRLAFTDLAIEDNRNVHIKQEDVRVIPTLAPIVLTTPTQPPTPPPTPPALVTTAPKPKSQGVTVLFGSRRSDPFVVRTPAPPVQQTESEPEILSPSPPSARPQSPSPSNKTDRGQLDIISEFDQSGIPRNSDKDSFPRTAPAFTPRSQLPRQMHDWLSTWRNVGRFFGRKA